MKFVVGVVLIIAATFIPNYQCFEKALNIEVTYYNPKYNSPDTLQVYVDEYNKTNNYELFHWDLQKDLPKDISLAAKVYASNSNGEKGKLLLEINIPICEESTFRQYLPDFLRVPEEKLGKVCIPKNNYYETYVGQLDVEGLIPKLESKYVLIENSLVSSSENILGWIVLIEITSD